MKIEHVSLFYQIRRSYEFRCYTNGISNPFILRLRHLSSFFSDRRQLDYISCLGNTNLMNNDEK